MTNVRIRVLTHLSARAGREPDLKNLLVQLMEQGYQQAGCGSCELLQKQVDSTDFILIEEWSAEARLKSDFNSPILQRLFEEGAELLNEPPRIDWYEVAIPQAYTS